MAAGNGGSGFGAWVSGAWSDVEDENASTAFDGDVYSAMAGVDYRITPRAVVGIALGYENTDLDTAYNGFGGADGNLDADGWTVAPYIGVELAPNVSANLAVGYSDLEYDTLRFDPNSGNRITGSTDADRYFVNASVNGLHEFDQNWRLHGSSAVFYASEDKDAFTETESNAALIANSGQSTDFGQVSVDARLGYLMQGFEPYALAGVEFDFSKDEAPVAAGQSRASLDDSDFGAKFGGGVKLHLGPNVTGGVELYTVEFRDDYNEYTLSGGLNVKF
jgi:outer membrane autotransporter protein